MMQKNDFIYSDVCQVYLRSVGKGFSNWDDFIQVYGTPKKIKFSVSDKYTNGGIEYTYKIKLHYPGLDRSNFADFNRLIHDRFVARLVITSNQKTYEVGSADVPLELTTKFNAGGGTDLLLQTKSIYAVNFLGTIENLAIDGFPYELKAGL